MSKKPIMWLHDNGDLDTAPEAREHIVEKELTAMRSGMLRAAEICQKNDHYMNWRNFYNLINEAAKSLSESETGERSEQELNSDSN